MRYYSIPATAEINQNEYHELAWACKDIEKECIKYWRSILQAKQDIAAKYAGGGYGSLHKEISNMQKNMSSLVHNLKVEQITLYLQRVATLTSMRLLSDLKELDFKI